jgi:hypothetical protein
MATNIRPILALCLPVVFCAVAANAQSSSGTSRENAPALSTGVGDQQSSSFRLESTLSGPLAAGRSQSASYINYAGHQFTLLGSDVETFSTNIKHVITGYYETVLGREPDTGGLDFWSGEALRVQGLGGDIREVFFAMAIQFFNSPEYLGRNTSDAQYLTDLYNTFFSPTACRPTRSATRTRWTR